MTKKTLLEHLLHFPDEAEIYVATLSKHCRVVRVNGRCKISGPAPQQPVIVFDTEPPLVEWTYQREALAEASIEASKFRIAQNELKAQISGTMLVQLDGQPVTSNLIPAYPGRRIDRFVFEPEKLINILTSLTPEHDATQ